MALDINFRSFVCLSHLFRFNEIMHLLSSFAFVYLDFLGELTTYVKTLCTFKQTESESLIKTQTYCIENN
jgi:hypothetical protein